MGWTRWLYINTSTRPFLGSDPAFVAVGSLIGCQTGFCRGGEGGWCDRKWFVRLLSIKGQMWILGKLVISLSCTGSQNRLSRLSDWRARCQRGIRSADGAWFEQKSSAFHRTWQAPPWWRPAGPHLSFSPRSSASLSPSAMSASAPSSDRPSSTCFLWLPPVRLPPLRLVQNTRYFYVPTLHHKIFWLYFNFAY